MPNDHPYARDGQHADEQGQEKGVFCPLVPIVIRSSRRSHVVCIFEASVRVARVTIPDDVAKFFMVEGIVIDRALQTADANLAIPAAIFSPMAVGIALGLDTMRDGSTFDLIIRNTDTVDQQFYGALSGWAIGEIFRAVPTDEQYHAYIERRQALYESIHDKVDPEERDDVFFNGQQIFADTFSPKTRRWWVDENGYEVRPVYGIENVEIGDSKGTLRVVDLDTYEGFE